MAPTLSWIMSWESKCVSRGNIGHSIGQNWSWRNLRNWGSILIFLTIGFNINIFGERWGTDIILTCLSTGETGVAILAMWFSPDIWNIYTKLKIVSQTIPWHDICKFKHNWKLFPRQSPDMIFGKFTQNWKLYPRHIWIKLNCIPDNLFSDTHESEVKRCPSVNGES